MVLPGLIAYSYILPMLYIELTIVVALILLNGLLALAELAIVSSRRARLQALDFVGLPADQLLERMVELSSR